MHSRIRSQRAATAVRTRWPVESDALMRVLLRIPGIVWASPYTLIGLFLGGIGLCTGGRTRIRGRVIEFYGGAVKWMVVHLPHGQFTLAFTLGHTVLGQSDASLDVALKGFRDAAKDTFGLKFARELAAEWPNPRFPKKVVWH